MVNSDVAHAQLLRLENYLCIFRDLRVFFQSRMDFGKSTAHFGMEKEWLLMQRNRSHTQNENHRMHFPAAAALMPRNPTLAELVLNISQQMERIAARSPQVCMRIPIVHSVEIRAPVILQLSSAAKAPCTPDASQTDECFELDDQQTFPDDAGKAETAVSPYEEAEKADSSENCCFFVVDDEEDGEHLFLPDRSDSDEVQYSIPYFTN